MILSSTACRAVVALAALALLPHAAPCEQSPAYTLLMRGHVDEASKLLATAIAASPGDGTAHLLLCRADFAQELPDQAVAECQQAVTALPSSSEAEMWLGRALGLNASHANPVTAYSLAKRVHAAFERAVQLNPRDTAAASDLGEFYISAPGMVGGGAEKLDDLIRLHLADAPAKAHRLLALRLEKNKDLPAAEGEYKLAIAAGKTPEAYSDLALFYQRHKRADDALAAAKQAFAADSGRGPVEADLASILTDAKRAPDLAIAALRAYLTSANQTDAAPVFKVRVLLGKLLLKSGDKAGAKYEFATAVALAPAYEPARKALAGV